jgi:fimbrial chaperone protein
VLVEGKESLVANPDGVRLPVAGRIGVIVYVKVGDATASLDFFGAAIRILNGRAIPTLRVHNAGTAHARLFGFLSGQDAKGARYDLNPSDFPILPGEVADIYLIPSTATDDHPTLAFPVRVTGTLEWGDQKTEVNELVE